MHGRFASLVAVSLLLPLLLSPVLGAAAPACTATSGATVPAVVELYTSEGCDSCPPADRWLGSLKAAAARGAVLPLAFHIDYWDYLGWKDPFADPAFGARHREMASAGGAKVVYTPQVLYDGREFQAWRRTPAQKLALDGAKAARAEMKIAAFVSSDNKRQLNVTVSGRTLQNARGRDAYVAIYENDLASDVKAGENRGVVLHHDFVVRRLLGPFAFNGGSLEIAQSIDLPAGIKLDRSGVAIFAHDEKGAVIQAIALPLRDCAG